MTGLEFRNELVKRLNNNANRYIGGTCNGTYYPETELFEVDEIYEMIDRVLNNIPEDIGEVKKRNKTLISWEEFYENEHRKNSN